MKTTTNAKFKEALVTAANLFVLMSQGKEIKNKSGRVTGHEGENTLEYVRGRFLWGIAGNCQFNIAGQDAQIHKTTEEIRAGIIPGATHGLSEYMVGVKLNFITKCEDQRAEWEGAFVLAKEVYQEQTGQVWQGRSTDNRDKIDRTEVNDKLVALGLPPLAEPATDGTLSEPKVA